MRAATSRVGPGKLAAAMDWNWIARTKTLMLQNRPSRKPQLWEDLPLAVRRRVELELRQRTQSDWMDTPHVVELSLAGTDHAGPPTRMSLMLRDTIARALFLYGTYEICGTRLIQAFLRTGMNFVDVGANIGYYTLLAARAVGEAGAVFRVRAERSRAPPAGRESPPEWPPRLCRRPSAGGDALVGRESVLPERGRRQ